MTIFFLPFALDIWKHLKKKNLLNKNMNMTKKILEIHPTSPLADVEHSDEDLQITDNSGV